MSEPAMNELPRCFRLPKAFYRRQQSFPFSKGRGKASHGLHRQILLHALDQKQSDRVRPHQVKTYTSHFERHILPAKVDGGAFGKLHLLSLTADHLRSLQDRLKAKGLKSASVNAVVHSSLRAMLRDARGEGAMTTDLYDRAIFKPLPLTEMNPSIDPYTPEEREAILEGFRSKRPQFYPFVFFHFWQGPRPRESTTLRRKSVDLRYFTAAIERSRVQGQEAGYQDSEEQPRDPPTRQRGRGPKSPHASSRGSGGLPFHHSLRNPHRHRKFLQARMASDATKAQH
jgi:hypothetical protein